MQNFSINNGKALLLHLVILLYAQYLTYLKYMILRSDSCEDKIAA